MATALVQRFEGCHRRMSDGRIAPYLCPAGYPTQGWGIVVPSMDVPPITQAMADAVLARELSGSVDVLIVANPCFGLDFASVAEIRAQIMEQRNNGAAVLLFVVGKLKS